MNNDPISQLPEAYRAAWSIFQEPLNREVILSKILESAKTIADADWGMILIADNEEDSHTLVPPDMITSRIPIGYLAWLAYSIGKQVIRSGQSIVIANTAEIVEVDAVNLINEFLPLKEREDTISRAKQAMLPSIYLDIPETMPFTVFSAPIIFQRKAIASVYLTRPMLQGVFDTETLRQVETFLSLVGVAIKNAEVLENNQAMARNFPMLLASELKNPLTSIKGYASLLLSPSNMLPDKREITVEKREEFLQKILFYTEQLSDMIRTFVNLARIDGGFATRYTMTLDAAISPVIEKYRSLFQTKHQILHLDMTCDLATEVEAGYNLSQVIDALIRNAHLYTPEGGQIRIGASLTDDIFSFSISDTGFGLKEDEIPHLFDRFYRSFRQEIRSIYGIGMGLYIAKGFVELWGGQIGAEGTENQGSTFWFTLPIKREQTQNRQIT